MKSVNWGIQGYLVIFNGQVVGQFDNAGWAIEFQKLVSHIRAGKPVILLADDCNSTMVTDEKEESVSNESKD